MKRFKEILCVLESESSAEVALERAVTLAENNHANLTLASVVPRQDSAVWMPATGPDPARLQETAIRTQRETLERLLEPYRPRLRAQVRIFMGIPFLEIVRAVLRDGYDLVIKVPESGDWLERLFGSNDMHLLRKCPCPVWLIKPVAPKAYRSILAAIDVSDAYPAAELASREQLNRQIMEISTSLALSEFAELHLVHVWEAVSENTMRGAFVMSPEAQISDYVGEVHRHHEALFDSFIHTTLQQLDKDALDYLKPQRHLIKGWPRKEIPSLARQLQSDLVVMGTVGRTGVPGFFMGNTAETILNQLDCSVMAIKPPGFTTPVTLEA